MASCLQRSKVPWACENTTNQPQTLQEHIWKASRQTIFFKKVSTKY